MVYSKLYGGRRLNKQVHKSLKIKKKVKEKASNRVDFDHPELCANTYPISCIISGQEIGIERQSWAQLLIAITEWFIAQNNPYLASLDRTPLYGGLMFFMKVKHKRLTSYELSNSMWICTNYDSQTLVKIIGNLCRHCKVDLRQVNIMYAIKKEHTSQTRKATKDPTPSNPHQTKPMTIKRAIIQVLVSEKRPMTSEEIYNQIIKRNLYIFGAQNPSQVVHTTLDYWSDNSGYTRKFSPQCFHMHRNNDGKRAYEMLETINKNKLHEQKTLFTETSTPNKRNLIIWNDTIKNDHKKWLENENYSPKTINNYCRCLALTFIHYDVIAQKAVHLSTTEESAVRTFISLLRKDGGFIEENTKNHNAYTAALSSLARFNKSRKDSIPKESNNAKAKQQKSLPNPVSPLDDIVDLEEGKAGIRDIINAHFYTLHGYSNVDILWNAMQGSLSMFLNDNAINNADDLWRFISLAFSSDYVMKHPHIWKTLPDYPQNHVGIIVNLARHLGGLVTRKQIDEYFASIKQNSPGNALIIRDGLLVFYDREQLILTETVDMTNERCKAVSKSLDKLFRHEDAMYIILRDITVEWFSSLPLINGDIQWTPLLLQEVLRLHVSIGYKVILPGLKNQAYDIFGAAIVPHTSNIAYFADIVYLFCYENNLLGKKMYTEDLRILLRNAGMIAGNELIYRLHIVLKDYRFAFTDENTMVKILER